MSIFLGYISLISNFDTQMMTLLMEQYRLVIDIVKVITPVINKV